jgi:hypothetical protein
MLERPAEPESGAGSLFHGRVPGHPESGGGGKNLNREEA